MTPNFRLQLQSHASVFENAVLHSFDVISCHCCAWHANVNTITDRLTAVVKKEHTTQIHVM